MKPKLRALKTSSAFTLVEILLAIAVFSFAIVGILGVIVYALNSDQGAANDTFIARMAEITFAQLKQQGFEAAHTNTAFADTLPDFYFNNYGELSTNASGAPATTAQPTTYYSCTVTRQTTSPSPSLDYYTLLFQWPVSAPAANQQKRTLNATLANSAEQTPPP